MMFPALAASPLPRPSCPRFAESRCVGMGIDRLSGRGIRFLTATHAPTLPGRTIN